MPYSQAVCTQREGIYKEGVVGVRNPKGHYRILPSMVIWVLVFFKVRDLFSPNKHSVYICHPDTETLNCNMFYFVLTWECYHLYFSEMHIEEAGISVAMLT